MKTLNWKAYLPLIEGITTLFNPLVEVAIHDLKQGKIVAIFNNLSKRKVGDTSPLHELKIDSQNFPDIFPPYYKTNWDGSPLKCTSITLRNEKREAIGLICINVDTRLLADAHQLISTFLKIEPTADNPVELFCSKWEKQINEFIDIFLIEKSLTLNGLNREQKQELVVFLYKKGTFNFKNAPSYIAKKLKISRATIYNHIKQI